jgi:ATP-dependent Clp protease ATP-binding subunit ClpX
LERKTGARGLRTIIEHALLDTMYELPSTEHIAKVVVDENVVTGEALPYLIYQDEDQQCVCA